VVSGSGMSAAAGAAAGAAGGAARGLLMERLRLLLASKERLVYALSHELTTPINGMLGERTDSLVVTRCQA
jgi:signal transduction histidine kinase